MRFHSQNLSENHDGSTPRSKFWNGRCWLHFETFTIGLEWSFLVSRLSIGIGLADYDHALSGHFCIGRVNLYWHLEYFPLYRWLEHKIKRPDQKYGNGRTIGFYWLDGSLSIDLWHDPMEHRRADPKWWHFYITPRDILFGRPVYSERVLKTSRVEVPMPEAVYPAEVKIEEATWKRPRWPWPLRRIRAKITPDTPIPFPGKGENSWDCGEDATHSMTCNATNEQEAVAKLVASVLNDRYRHGGKNWRPAAVKHGR
jgi:hypothetical protein